MVVHRPDIHLFTMDGWALKGASGLACGLPDAVPGLTVIGSDHKLKRGYRNRLNSVI